jgi:hypothetical protein
MINVIRSTRLSGPRCRDLDRVKVRAGDLVVILVVIKVKDPDKGKVDPNPCRGTR